MSIESEPPPEVRKTFAPSTGESAATRVASSSAGGFVSYNIGGPEISLSGGYVWDLRAAAPGAPSADSVYGALGLTFRF